MCQKHVLILQPNKISQDGPYPKLADPIMMQRNLTEIKLTIPDLPSANNVTQKIHRLDKLILVQQAEMELRDLEPSKIRCRVDKV